MKTIYHLLAITLIASITGFTKPNNERENNQLGNHQLTNNQLAKEQLTKQKLTQKILHIANSQIGLREATGNNDGAAVEQYLSYTGNKKGEPWCAAFVSWVFGQAGLTAPRTAWSPALFPQSRMSKVAQPAAVFGIYFPDKGRVAHVGLVEQQQGNWLYTIEGNTNIAESREGDGVYKKLRHVRTIKYYADWLNTKGGKQ